LIGRKHKVYADAQCPIDDRKPEIENRLLPVTQLVQLVLIQTEMVPQLVEQRDPDLFGKQLFVRLTQLSGDLLGVLHQRGAEDLDLRRQIVILVHGALGQCRACVEAKKTLARLQAKVFKQLDLGVVFDKNRHFFDGIAILIRQ